MASSGPPAGLHSGNGTRKTRLEDQIVDELIAEIGKTGAAIAALPPEVRSEMAGKDLCGRTVHIGGLLRVWLPIGPMPRLDPGGFAVAPLIGLDGQWPGICGRIDRSVHDALARIN